MEPRAWAARFCFKIFRIPPCFHGRAAAFGCGRNRRDRSQNRFPPVPKGWAGWKLAYQPQYDLTTPSLNISQLQPTTRGFTPGVEYSTSLPTDLAVRGTGFFILRETNSGALCASRAGAFWVDPNGYLVNYAGWRVQGYTNDCLCGIGDIVIDATDRPATFSTNALMNDWSIDRSGKITVGLEDGTSYLRGQILLQDCAAPQELTRGQWGLYARDAGAGPWTQATAPGDTGLGWLLPGALEISQLDEEMLYARQRGNFNFLIQGSVNATGNPTDLAIIGPGFFMVREPHTGVQYATRQGLFHTDGAGFLVTAHELRVQGFSDAALTTVGDVKIDTSGMPSTANRSASVVNYTIDFQGKVNVNLSDETGFVRGQVLLQNFRNPSALMPEPYNLWSNVAAAMPMFANGVPGPNALALGVIQSGALETPATVPEIRLLPQSGVRLTVSDLPDIPWLVTEVEASSDLVHWSSCGQIQAVNDMGQAEAVDSAPGPGAVRAYRIRLWPAPNQSPPYYAGPFTVGACQLATP